MAENPDVAAVAEPPCPRCGEALGDHGDHHLRCAACRGVFVRRAAVATMLEALQQLPPGPPPGSPYRSNPESNVQLAAPPPEPSPRYLRCPFCARLMNRTRIVADLSIVVDMCHLDGVWFDAGELELAAAHLRTRHDQEPDNPLARPAALLDELFGRPRKA